ERIGSPAPTRHGHFAILEVESLADAEALAFETIVLDPAVGHVEGQLVLVTDTVAAAEAVVAPQRGVVEAVLDGVEYRDVVLILFRYIEVEGARLQGTAIVVAERLGVAVEVQAAVEAEDRHTAIRRVFEVRDLRFALGVQVQVVLGVGIFQARLGEAPGRFQRQADARLEVYAFAVGSRNAVDVLVVPAPLFDTIFVGKETTAQVAVETHVLGAVEQVQTAGLERQLPVQGELRQ